LPYETHARSGSGDRYPIVLCRTSYGQHAAQALVA